MAAAKSRQDPFPYPNEVYPTDWFRRLELGEVFERQEAPVEVDLGCGDGGFLLAMAEAYPQRNFLGVERLLGRVRKVCRGADKRGLTNVRALRVETTYAIEWLLPRAFADRVHLLFPDPWPKEKHRKHRLMLQAGFLRSVHHLLKPGGEFIFKTDHEDYFSEASAFVKEEGLEWFVPIPWEEGESGKDPAFYAETDFERHWKTQGCTIQALRLKRV